MPLIRAIDRLVQSVGAGSQVDGRTDRSHGAERRPVAPLPGQLQHQVAAHGVAHQRHPLQAVQPGKMIHHRAHVAGEPGVVERGRQRVRVRAVAHVHADHVAARIPCARGNALNVAGVGRAFKAMNQHHREPRGPLRLGLPVAMAQHAAAIRGIHLDRFGDGGEPKRRTGQIIANDRLQVAVAEAAARLKRRQTRQRRRSVAAASLNSAIFMGFRGHGDSAIQPTGPIVPPAVCADWDALGRLVGIEPTTS